MNRARLGDNVAIAGDLAHVGPRLAALFTGQNGDGMRALEAGRLSLAERPFIGFDTIALPVFAMVCGLDGIATMPPTVRLAG